MLEAFSLNTVGVKHLIQARLGAAANLTPSTIHLMSKEGLLSLQESSALGSEWGTIEMPARWFPNGKSGSQANRRVSVNGLAGDPVDVEAARLVFCRFALLLLYCKVSSRGVNGRFLAPSTIRGSLQNLKLILQQTLQVAGAKGAPLIARLTRTDLAQVSASAQRTNELRRMREFANRGLWSDVAAEMELGSVEDSIAVSVAGASIPQRKTPAPYQPLPDNFVAEAGWRLIWIVENLGPSILRCGLELASIRQHSRSRKTVAKQMSDFLSGFAWVDETGKEIVRPPFDCFEGGDSIRRDEPLEWPPRNFLDFMKLLALLQDAHLFLFLLSTGGRISEALSLTPDCIVSTVQGHEAVEGRTYKLVFENAGAKREWPLPALALNAVRQQRDVAAVLNALGAEKRSKRGLIAPEALFVSGRGLEVSQNPTKRFMISMRTVGVAALLSGGNLASHRFRKTLARLVALAIVGSPKVLMDLFGHKSIEMTLHYMTTDPELRAEIAEVARAQTLMFAEKAIEHADTNGGGGAARIRAVVRAERVRLGREFGENDLRGLAETLTDNGTSWMLVRPGVLCTKTSGQSGPCNSSLGRPEPSRCRAVCSHRLEDEALRDDVERAIKEAVELLEEAVEQDAEIQAEMWRGQILAHLPRFADIAAKWSSHPTVSNLLERGVVAEEAVV